MADTEGKGDLAPAAVDAVNVRTADTAALN